MNPPARGGPLTLVIGGARSGKSRFAESLVTISGLAKIYVATAQARDGEMAERIARHRNDRGDGWRTVEAPRDLAGAIAKEAAPDRSLLVDCLTLWLTNVMLGEAEPDVDGAVDRLLEALVSAQGPVTLVSNEVGYGVVPENALARAFRDHQGRLNQRVAAAADRVTLVAAGLPLDLKLAKSPT